MKKFKKRDVSTAMRPNEEGVIDKVLVTTNSDGYKYCKVKIRSTRTPVVGDKLASRHGQKGTIGMIYRHEDMPFTEDGIVPDLIINPHAIPSRMTIGHLSECLLAKVCTITGQRRRSTPFNAAHVSEIFKLLEQCGYAGDGTETLYNGESGEPMEAKIFIGPTYYQRFKHMVNEAKKYTQDRLDLLQNEQDNHSKVAPKTADLNSERWNVMFSVRMVPPIC